MSKLKVLELFGGIGACSKALERIGIDYEIADYVEIDKYAVASFNGIHNTNFEPQDICTWDKQIEVDLIMHGSPCQDFSLAGKQAGGDIGSGTRSSLMYETIRIVGKLRPKYVIWENVKNVISKKHWHNFENYLNTMKALGYTNNFKVMNAKNYGIPQNRERVFTISIRNDIEKDFEFPKEKELKLKLKDMLEDNVDKKYYLSQKLIDCFMSDGTGGYPRRERFLQNINKPNRETANAIITTEGNKPTCNFIKKYGSYYTWENKKGEYNTQCNRASDVEEYSLTIPTIPGQNKILIKNATKQGYLEATIGDGIDISSRMQHHRGTVQKELIQTLDCTGGEGHGVITKDLRIRKLTPKECWRLMGFDDEDFDKASKVNSNTQLYKQAGNSIVVQCLEEILKQLLGGME